MEFQVDEKLLVAIPAIVALLQAIKAIPILNKIRDWFPLLSIVLGVAVSCTILDQPIATEIIAGIVLGAAAAGTFSGLKATAVLARSLDNTEV